VAAFQGRPLPSGLRSTLTGHLSILRMIGGGCRSRYVCCLDSEKIIDGEMLSWQPASLDRLRTASEGVISERTAQCQAASRVHQLRNSRISVLSPLPFCLWARLTAEKEHSLCFPWETPTCSGQGSDSEIWKEKSVNMVPAQQATLPDVVWEPSITESVPSKANFACHEPRPSVLQR
jgi:hypothetical protein